jgi:hypothetical protein
VTEEKKSGSFIHPLNTETILSNINSTITHAHLHKDQEKGKKAHVFVYIYIYERREGNEDEKDI